MLKLEDLKTVNRYAESTKSLTFLPIVHERQTQRMKTRSEWFLNPSTFKRHICYWSNYWLTNVYYITLQKKVQLLQVTLAATALAMRALRYLHLQPATCLQALDLSNWRPPSARNMWSPTSHSYERRPRKRSESFVGLPRRKTRKMVASRRRRQSLRVPLLGPRKGSLSRTPTVPENRFARWTLPSLTSRAISPTCIHFL